MMYKLLRNWLSYKDSQYFVSQCIFLFHKFAKYLNTTQYLAGKYQG